MSDTNNENEGSQIEAEYIYGGAPIIIDNGSNSLKVGFADQTEPSEIQSVIGGPRYPKLYDSSPKVHK